jgi:hypothetical protein
MARWSCDADEMVEHRAADAATPGHLRRMHGFDLGVAGLKLLQGSDREELATFPVAEEGDCRIEQSVGAERVHMLGSGVRVREVEVPRHVRSGGADGDEADGGTARAYASPVPAPRSGQGAAPVYAARHRSAAAFAASASVPAATLASRQRSLLSIMNNLPSSEAIHAAASCGSTVAPPCDR